MPNYDINYDDSRFQKVETAQTDALDKNNETYDKMIDKSDSFYQSQIDEVEKYKNEQTKNQKEQLALTEEKIEEQKNQTKKDYIKEQSGAYVDWRKQSNEYGANAEEMAASGLSQTGYSESSQVSMYNTYQNRLATAREAYTRAVTNYDIAIKEARLQNSAALAEIAYNAQKEQLELALEGFQYKNQLVLEKANKEMEIKKFYSDEYQRVLDQINTENALAEEIRQYNEKMAEEKRQFDKEYALEEQQLALQQQQLQISKNRSASGSKGSRTVTKKTSKTGGSTSSGTAGIVKSGQATQVSQYELDTKSVMNLGQGPISGTNLANQVNSGKVTAKTSGKKITVGYGNPTKDLLYSSKRF